VVHIRLVVPIITEGLRTSEHAAALGDKDTEVSVSILDHGPETIEGVFDEAFAVPDTISKIMQAEQEGCDAVVIDCMGDPGLAAAREAVSIPVLGPAQSAMHLASMLGYKFSVVTVLRRLHPLIDELARVYGVSSNMASIRSIEIPVIELEDDPKRLSQALVEQSVLAVQKDEADVIILGCTGIHGLAEEIQKGLKVAGIEGIPVVDPVAAAIAVAKALLQCKLTHSKYAYENPRYKEIRGFDLPGYLSE